MGRSEGNMSLKIRVKPPGIDPRTVQPVAQCLNHYATPGPLLTRIRKLISIFFPKTQEEFHCLISGY